MSVIWQEWAVRVVPPRAGSVRAVAANATSQAVQIDNDILMIAAGGSGANIPGNYGQALVRFHAENNDCYISFGSANGVAVNSAATSGNTVCARIPAGQERDFELSPSTDKYFAVATQNGGSLTATLRYWVTTYPKSRDGGTQGGA